MIAEKMTGEKSRDYMNARRVAKEYEAITRGLDRAFLSLPPCGSIEEIKQVIYFLFFYLGNYWNFKVLSLLETCFDLISGSSLSIKFQIMGRKMTEICGQIVFVLFSLNFQIRQTKVDIFYFNHFLVSCLIN